MLCKDCEKNRPLRKVNSGSIMDNWVEVKTLFNRIRYSVKVSFLIFEIIGKPTLDEDFRITAKVDVSYRLNDLITHEIYEIGFEAIIAYSDREETYFVKYEVPYRKKVQGIVMNTICGFKQRFGKAISVANYKFLEEAYPFIKNFVDKSKITPTD